MLIPFERLLGVKIEERFICSEEPQEVYDIIADIEIPKFSTYRIDKDELWLRFESSFKIYAYPDLIDIKVSPNELGSMVHFKVRKGHLLGIFHHMKRSYGVVLSEIKNVLDLREFR